MAGYGGSPYGSVPYGALPAGGYFVVDLTSAAAGVDTFPDAVPFRRIDSGASSSDSIATLLAMHMSDGADASDATATYLYALEDLLSEAEANDRLQQVLTELMESEADASSLTTTILTRYESLRDVLIATDAFSSYLDASNALFAAAVASDVLRPAYSATISSTANATDTLVDIILAIARLFAEAEASSSMSNTLRMLVLMEDEAEASGTLLSSAQLLGLLQSGASAAVILRIGDDEFTAWVMNTENIAVSQYTNYPFNSFAELNGRHYGAAHDGLYLLEGDDDAGTAIQAYLRSPLTDFGIPNLKRLPEVYFGYTASGDMVFKAVVVSPNGVKEEHWYRLEERPAASVAGTRETRVPVGKGLHSVYWQFELHNINGADFQYQTVRLWPMVLSRRVR